MGGALRKSECSAVVAFSANMVSFLVMEIACEYPAEETNEDEDPEEGQAETSPDPRLSTIKICMIKIKYMHNFEVHIIKFSLMTTSHF